MVTLGTGPPLPSKVEMLPSKQGKVSWPYLVVPKGSLKNKTKRNKKQPKKSQY